MHSHHQFPLEYFFLPKCARCFTDKTLKATAVSVNATRGKEGACTGTETSRAPTPSSFSTSVRRSSSSMSEIVDKRTSASRRKKRSAGASGAAATGWPRKTARASTPRGSPKQATCGRVTTACATRAQGEAAGRLARPASRSFSTKATSSPSTASSSSTASTRFYPARSPLFRRRRCQRGPSSTCAAASGSPLCGGTRTAPVEEGWRRKSVAIGLKVEGAPRRQLWPALLRSALRCLLLVAWATKLAPRQPKSTLPKNCALNASQCSTGQKWWTMPRRLPRWWLPRWRLPRWRLPRQRRKTNTRFFSRLSPPSRLLLLRCRRPLPTSLRSWWPPG
mmetsp:Transcript_9322/g.18372  ORF Transcript_9322/g.18372 Transcript_9322/m.18372 type:complete len:335 (+) Transcript_9322:388-1392(+)